MNFQKRGRLTMRNLYAPFVILLAVIALAETRTTAARATIQPELCIAPDIEYPVPCDEDDDDGGVGANGTLAALTL
jgi:hypothetical protein